jgi:hypothetical protein
MTESILLALFFGSVGLLAVCGILWVVSHFVGKIVGNPDSVYRIENAAPRPPAPTTSRAAFKKFLGMTSLIP